MRYDDETGQFFIREIELERMYREVPSKEEVVLKLNKIIGLEEICCL